MTVSTDEVLIILPKGHTLTVDQVKVAIDTATLLVSRIAADCGGDLIPAELKQIELYLSAHFAALSDYSLAITSETDGCSNGKLTYGWDLGEGIKGTPFGQQADLLSGGCLASLNAPAVGIYAIGSI